MFREESLESPSVSRVFGKLTYIKVSVSEEDQSATRCCST